MKDTNGRADSAEHKSKSTPYSATQMAAAGIGGAIVLLVLIIVISLMSHA